jgi:hypothetical protein
MPIAIRRIANFSNRESLGAKLGEQFRLFGADDELLFNSSIEIRCGTRMISASRALSAACALSMRKQH